MNDQADVPDNLLLHRHTPHLAGRALQDDAVVKELGSAGYAIENRTKHSGQQVHGEFRLVSCPGDADVRMISAAFSAGTSDL